MVQFQKGSFMFCSCLDLKSQNDNNMAANSEETPLNLIFDSLSTSIMTLSQLIDVKRVFLNSCR